MLFNQNPCIMKKLFTCFFLLPLLIQAQDCSNYIFMTGNSTVQMAVYDKKGKENGTQTWKVLDVKKNGNSYESSVTSSFKDAKGKEIDNSNGVYIFDGGILKADVRMSMPQQQMEAYKDAEAKFESAYIEYPSRLNIGQSLKDVDFKMDIDNKGTTTTVTFNMTNRKVEAKEKITTPAGSWDAYVISYQSSFKTQLGPIGIPINMEGKEWFVPGVGIVRTETYNKGGKLMGSTQLTSITK